MSSAASARQPAVPAPTRRPTSTPVLRRRCACEAASPDCDDCRAQPSLLRRTAAGAAGPLIAPPIVHGVLRSGGRPLDPATRGFMETRFHHDFSGVRVHSDATAAASARAVNALAYTVGQHVVLPGGHPEVASTAGRHLLAHELAHVVQHGGGGPSPGPSLRVGDARDPAEAEADATADRALAAGAAGAAAPPARQLPAPGPPLLRRKVLNQVVKDFQTGAQACVVHIHGEERTALAVAKEARARRCVNLMHLDTTQRVIDFTFTAGGARFTGTADPNRILTAAGRTGPAIQTRTADPGQPQAAKVPDATVKAAAVAELQGFADNDLIPALEACRKSAEEGGDPLPVVAAHNNEGLLVSEFKAVASKKRSPNPAMGDPTSRADFLLVTDPSDFDAFKGTRNVVLQENPIQAKNDDGSLSVLLAGSRFTNVEKEGRRHDKPAGKASGVPIHDAVYVKNYAMVSEVLDRYGVPKFPCRSSPDHESRTRSLFNRRLGASGRTTTALQTDKAVFEPDPKPEKPPAGCRRFEDQPALDRAADDWRARLERIPVANVVHWVLGGAKFAPAGALAEFAAQQSCLIKAMDARLKAERLGRPAGRIVLSEQRSFAAQEDIWQRKKTFAAGKPFDRISDFARTQCPALGTDRRWDPREPEHQACWKTVLTGEEQEKEILMASSAPGISRHHTGVDFDFGQKDAHLDPKAWTGTGEFADAYRWLARNASAYGFIQPFDTKGGYGKGYISERWHWSYFPIAQAALEFVMDHELEVTQALDRLWSADKATGKGGVKPEFSFIRQNWQKYLFNVEDTGVF